MRSILSPLPYGRIKAVLALLFFLVMLTPSARAATRYVRAGSNGSGGDWNSATGCLPANLVRGDTYYVASGNYGSCGLYVFDDPVSGTLVITIKKATLTDHGTETGWQISFASGQAIFQPWTIQSDNYVIDGQSRSSLEGGHGIKILNRSGSGAPFERNFALMLGTGAFTFIPVPARNITLRFVEVEGSGDRTGTHSDRGVWIQQGARNVLIQQCSIHDIGEVPLLFDGSQDTVFEDSWLARNQSTPSFHSEGIAMRAGGPTGVQNLTIRNNLFEDIEGTAFIATPNNFIAAIARDIYIYGNVFMRSVANPKGQSGVGDGIISFFDVTVQGDVFILNNSIVNIRQNAGASRFNIQMFPPLANLGNVRIQNNVWYRSEAMSNSNTGCSTCQTYVYTHNAYFDTPAANDLDSNRQNSTGDPFVDSANKNFRLRNATNNGVSQASPFNLDFRAIIRGVDGTWDRGAFEFAIPTPPPNLRKSP